MFIRKFFSKPNYAADDGSAGTVVVDNTATAAAAAAAATPWYTGADPALVGHIQNRGWDKLDPKAAAIEAAKAHTEAERYVGVPANQIARIPTDPKDAAGWAALRQKLGAPSDANGYDFAALKAADGTAPDAKLIESIRATAFQRGLSKDDAVQVADSVLKYVEQTKSAEAQEHLAKVEADKTALRASWGANYEALLFVAKQAAAKLGVTPEAVETLEKQVGYKAVMEMFHKVGVAFGEDKFVAQSGPGGDGILTTEQAIDKRNSLKNDSAWVTKYLAGDAQAVREMTALNTIIAGGDDTQLSRHK